MLNEANQIHNFIYSSGSGTVINYGSGSDFLTSYGSGSTGQKVTVPVPQRCLHVDPDSAVSKMMQIHANLETATRNAVCGVEQKCLVKR